jgi:hypothetical protein
MVNTFREHILLKMVPNLLEIGKIIRNRVHFKSGIVKEDLL